MRLTQHDGTPLTGDPSYTIARIDAGTRSRYSRDLFSYAWSVTTGPIENRELPRLTFNLAGIRAEEKFIYGQTNSPFLIRNTDSTIDTHVHHFSATAPMVRVVRLGSIIQSVGGAGEDVTWAITFDQPVINVDEADFQIVGNNDIPINGVTFTLAAQDADGGSPEHARKFIITATLPTTGYSANEEVNLRIGNNDIMGSLGPTISSIDHTPIRRPFGVPTTITSSPNTHFILSTDTDDVEMTITRKDNATRTQTSRIDSVNPAQVSWTIAFSEPVEGIDVTGESNQFAIKLGESAIGVSHDSASTAVLVKRVTDSQYTATVTLPQSSYPDDTLLNLTIADTANALSRVTQKDNFHNNGVVSSDSAIDITDAGAILTDSTTDYKFNSGRRILTSITSATGETPSTVVFTLSFGARVSSLDAQNVSLTQADGITPLTSGSTLTLESVTPSSSRSGQSGQFSYVWTATTGVIPADETPRLTFTSTDVIAEGISGSTSLLTADADINTIVHSFVATSPIVSSVVRSSPDFVSAGGIGDAIVWKVIFDQPVIGVDKTDFQIIGEDGNSITDDFTVQSINGDGIGPDEQASIFIITAALPAVGYTTNENINLRIGDNNIEGREAPESTGSSNLLRQPFTSSSILTSSALDNHFILNNDDDDVIMTITRKDSVDRIRSPRIGSGPQDVSWTIEFSQIVTGVDITGISDQFAIKLGDQAIGESLDSGASVSVSTDVSVVGSGTTYTATVALPRAFYFVDTALNLTTKSDTQDALSSIRHASNAHNNSVVSSDDNIDVTATGAILTTAANNYEFSTGARTLESITSQTGPNRTVIFTLTFGARVDIITARNFTLSQADGSLLTGTPSISVERGDSSLSRQSGQSGQFSYVWRITTGSIAIGESPRLAITDLSDVTAEGPIGSGSMSLPTDGSETHVHYFSVGAPTVSNIERVSTDKISGGGLGESVAWDITFDQPVINVDKADFEVFDETGSSIAGTFISVRVIDGDGNTPESATNFIITATLPTDGYDASDEQVNLRIGANDIMGIASMTLSSSSTASTRAPFGPPTDLSSESTDTHFILNTDNDFVVMTISRNAATRELSPRVDSGPRTASWAIEFSSPVRGVDVDGTSDQFAIKLGGQDIGTSLHSSPFAVSLTGSGRHYTATVTLPQTSYFDDNVLNLATADRSNSLSDIKQSDNSHENRITILRSGNPLAISNPRVILTDATNNYEFSTGPRMLTSITSMDKNPKKVIFTLTFGARVTSLEDQDFRITQASGVPLSGNSNLTIKPIDASSSLTGQSGRFAYIWTVTTSSIKNNEIPKLAFISDNVTVEGPEGSRNLLPATTAMSARIHLPFATNPIISSVERVGTDILSLGGSAATVQWTVTFNQPVINVSAANFQIVSTSATPISGAIASVEAINGTGQEPEQAAMYTVTATLPDSGHPTDTQVNLRIGDNTIMGSEAPESTGSSTMIRKPFTSAGTLTSSALNNNFVLNTDDEPVVMTITRKDDAPMVQTAKVNSRITQEASWTIAFDKPVTGVTTGITSTQFGIRLGDQVAGESYDSASTDIVVTKVSDTEYTATVALPQTSYFAPTALNLTTLNDNSLSDIVRNGSSHNNPVVSSDETIDVRNSAINLTNQTNNYSISTGSRSLLRLTSSEQNVSRRTLSFIATFGSRVSNIDRDNFTLTQADGAPLSGTPSFTVVPINSPNFPAASRTGQRGAFRYSYRITTQSIPEGQIPKLTFIADDSIVAEGPPNFRDLLIINDGRQYLAHRFTASYPTVKVTRADSDILSRGGIDTVAWNLSFDQAVINVEQDSFVIRGTDGTPITSASIRLETKDGDGETPEHARIFTITATLPDAGYTVDEVINLGVGENDIQGSLGPTSSHNDAPIRREFGDNLTLTSSPGNHFLLNNVVPPIIDPVDPPIDPPFAMTITRKDDAPQTQNPRVNPDNPPEVSWTITFNKPVTGVDVNGKSDQFAIKIGSHNIGESDDKASTDVMVTAVSQTEYTATVALPQALYFNYTNLDLTTANTADALDAIEPIGNSRNDFLRLDGIDITQAGAILTNNTNNYRFETGDVYLEVDSIDGATPRTIVFTLKFSVRIANLTAQNFELVQFISLLRGYEPVTTTPSQVSVSRVDTGTPHRYRHHKDQNQLFSHTWTVTTGVAPDHVFSPDLILRPKGIIVEVARGRNYITGDRNSSHDFAPTVPTIASVTRDDSDIQTAGGANDTIEWTVTFDQPVFEVSSDDFEVVDEDENPITNASIDLVDTSTSRRLPAIFTVTATLPEAGYTEDEEINLRINTDDIIGYSGPPNGDNNSFDYINPPFDPTPTILTSSSNSPPNHFIFNPDDDDVVMTITRKDSADRTQMSRIDSNNPSHVSWKIEFSDPVSGVDIEGISTQFAIKIGDEAIGNSIDSTSTDVMVTKVSDAEYTATVALPQSGYFTPTALNLTVADRPEGIDNIRQKNNFNNNGVVSSDRYIPKPRIRTILTTDSNNYEFSTGSRILTSITSTSTQSRQAIFALNFDARVSAVSLANLTITQADGVTPLSFNPTFTLSPQNPSASRIDQSGTFSYVWTVTTSAISVNEFPKLVFTEGNIIAEGTGNPNLFAADADTSSHLHLFEASEPNVEINRSSVNIVSVGGDDDIIIWSLRFNQPVSNLDKTDFVIVDATDTPIPNTVITAHSTDSNNANPPFATSFIVTARLPDTDYLTDTEVNLRVGPNDILGSEAPTSLNNPTLIQIGFTPNATLTSRSQDNHFILNNDDDDVVMTITRKDDVSRTQTSSVDSSITQEVSWTISFSKSVSGVDITSTSDQFAIKLGESAITHSNDSASSDVLVTEVSDTEYTATVALPQSGYSTETALNLAIASAPTFARIVQNDNSHLKLVMSSDENIDTTQPAEILTTDSNNYEFNTGARTIDSITSVTDLSNDDIVIFTATFGARVSDPTGGFTLSQHDDSPLTGTPSIVATPVGASASRFNDSTPTPSIPQSGDFSYVWTITTNAITTGEIPKLSFTGLSASHAEGPIASGAVDVPSDGSEFQIHMFNATSPIARASRIGADIVSGGGVDDTVAWTVRFDQFVINVDNSDFQILDANGNSLTTATIDIDIVDGDGSTPEQAREFIITATLPDENYDRNEEINLRISTSDIMGSEGPRSSSDRTIIRLPYSSPTTLTSASSNNHFVLNTDDDDVVMTIARTSGTDREQSPRVDGATHEVSWTIEFGDSVTGVDTDGESDQFAITLGGEYISYDSAPTAVMVTGSGTTYTARVSLPQSGYPSDTDLDLTTANSVNPLSAIIQEGNDHNNGVGITTARQVLTTDNTNDYVINTGAHEFAGISSTASTDITDRTIDFQVTFNSRVSNVTSNLFTITDSTGRPIAGIDHTSLTVTPIDGSASRYATDGARQFAYSWLVETSYYRHSWRFHTWRNISD